MKKVINILVPLVETQNTLLESHVKPEGIEPPAYLRLKLLGRHFGCRPLDPTLDIWSNFVKKKAFSLLF